MKSNFYISLGIWLVLIPLLGIPGVWRNNLITATGILLLLHVLWPVFLRKISEKSKFKKREKKDTTKNKTKLDISGKEEMTFGEITQNSQNLSDNQNSAQISESKSPTSEEVKL